MDARIANRPARKTTVVVLVALLCIALMPPVEAATQALHATAEWRWQKVGRVIALGAAHGDFDRLAELLEHIGVVDRALRWTGGEDHLVALGDLVGAGARSDRILELFMRLQSEASAAGGYVHVLLGERELMRMVTALTEPAHAAYGPGGRFGEWLLQQPVLIIINDTAFVHGGISRALRHTSAETLNSEAAEQLRAYVSVWHELLGRTDVPRETPFERGPSTALRSLQSASGTGAPADEVKTLSELSEATVLSRDGPLWYRGTVSCHPLTEWDIASDALSRLGARRVVLGHSGIADERILTRMGGRVVMLGASGPDASHEEHATALVLEDGQAWAVSAIEPSVHPTPEPRGVGVWPAGMDADALEAFMMSAPIVDIESLETGVTRPLRVTLEADGIRIRALFKTLATDIGPGSSPRADRLINRSDRYHYEVAAYRLDRLLGLDLVPVTVVREIESREGSLALWVDDLISVLEISRQGIEYAGDCSRNEQYRLMSVFDALIYNEDRTQQNTVFTRTAWRLHLIDHSRAFRTHRRRFPSYIQDPVWPAPVLSSELARRLQALDYPTLNKALGALLTPQQIRAILARRDLILKTWGSE